ncbi:hypothetical protein ACERZ8_20605 [Tateyamaria armeniaca]|uniref:Uncharacterized protein n=1 Tax=Tateyamaria armeniaca TaxID=2518930 RepID=A0ABW8UYE0_9RHOB
MTKTDVKALFSNDNMEALRKTKFKGEGTMGLNAAMKLVAAGVSNDDRMKVMKRLEEEVGSPPTADQLAVDYGRFLILRKQQQAIAGKEAEGLSEFMHGDFMGSRAQLMCGKVLGDAFGIHEVFGALLSPTGGLVGPGNLAVSLDPDNPIALHGTVHDAAGYLQNFHDQGPGYHYLDDKVQIIPASWPIAGQFDGIPYWVEKTSGDGVVKKTAAAVIALEKGLKTVRDAVASTIDNMLDFFRGKKDQDFEPQEDTAEEVLDTSQAIEDAVDKAQDATKQTRDPESTLGPDTPKETKDKLDAMSKFIWK